MQWEDLHVVLALARAGSHAGAARVLGVDATTIGRKLGALEQRLGARLFQRLGKQLVLTDAGTRLSLRAERVEAELRAAERELFGEDARSEGSVRLTASDGIVDHVLVPALPILLARAPALTVALRADARSLDLSQREADVAVRLVRPKEPALIARPLAPIAFGLFASVRYAAERGLPRDSAALSAHPLIGLSERLADTPQARWLARTVPGTRHPVAANSTAAQVQACLEGLGLALLPRVVARRIPGLVPVLPGCAPPPRTAYAVCHGELRKNARIATVLAWLPLAFEAVR